MKRLLQAPVFKYLLAGGLTFAVEYGSFYGMYSVLNLTLLPANSLSFCLGLFTSFFLNRLWTFKDGTHKRAANHQLALYAMLALINLLLVNLLLEGLRRIAVDPLIGKVGIMLLIPVWNYYIFKKFIFVFRNEP